MPLPLTDDERAIESEIAQSCDPDPCPGCQDTGWEYDDDYGYGPCPLCSAGNAIAELFDIPTNEEVRSMRQLYIVHKDGTMALVINRSERSNAAHADDLARYYRSAAWDYEYTGILEMEMTPVPHVTLWRPIYHDPELGDVPF